MAALLHLLSAFLPTASAMSLQEIGSGPGIREMWAEISNLFPFSFGAEMTPVAVFTGINSIILAIIASVAVVLLGYAAVLITTSGFSEQGMTHAKTIAKNVLIGLLAALAGDALIYWVVQLVWRIAGT